MKQQAGRAGIILWDFRNIIKDIAETFRKAKTYFTAVTFRTVRLFVKAEWSNDELLWERL